MPEDVVDAIASNVFVERQPGNIGSTVERLRFFEPTEFTAAKGVLIFYGPTGQRFTNSESVSISKSAMSINQDGSLFYVDIPIIAVEEGSAFNIDAGSITTMEAEPVNVANMTNLFLVDAGRNRETNTELIDRIKVAVTVRALVTGRGIIVTLTEEFTSIIEIQPVGFGNAEMMRDIVYNVHIGGNVDVWVRTPGFISQSQDAVGVKIDPTRRVANLSTLPLLLAGFAYGLGVASIDRTDRQPVVRSINDFPIYTEGLDFILDDATGTITRLALGDIFHIESLSDGNGTALTNKTLQSAGATFLQNVRAGMILTVSAPSSIQGRYTIKNALTANQIEIFGQFPAVPVGAVVVYNIDDLLSVSFDYNPASIDTIAAARSTARTAFTITNVPIMKITSVEVLDPLTLQPTGVLLNGLGGYGAGGFGQGVYGIGSEPDYRLVVTDPTLRFSAKEDNFILFQQLETGISVRVSYDYDANIAPLQAFCDDPQNRSETASLVVRHFIPAYVDAQKTIAYTVPASTQATALTSDAMTTVLKNAINDISNGRALEISDLVDLMYNNGADFVDLGTVESLKGEIHNQDGTTQFIYPNSNGVMAIPSLPIPDPTTRPLSPKIARYIAQNIVLSRSFS